MGDTDDTATEEEAVARDLMLSSLVTMDLGNRDLILSSPCQGAERCSMLKKIKQTKAQMVPSLILVSSVPIHIIHSPSPVQSSSLYFQGGQF
jgi:hypothetical protein